MELEVVNQVEGCQVEQVGVEQEVEREGGCDHQVQEWGMRKQECV